jgi:hypothetical protein
MKMLCHTLLWPMQEQQQQWLQQQRVSVLLLLHLRTSQGPMQSAQASAAAAAAAAATSTGSSSGLVLQPSTGAPLMSLVAWQQWRLLLLLWILTAAEQQHGTRQ